MGTQETIGNIKNVTSKVVNYGQALSSLYRKFDGIFNKNNRPATYTRDLILHGFGMNGSDVYTPQFFPRAFDEPTYLTFRIEFNFKNPYNVKPLEDFFQANDYDYLPEPFLEDYNIDNFLNEDYSTAKYLMMNKRDPVRADLLSKFKKALYDIQEIYPYYITDIKGITTLNKVEPSTGIRNKDSKITLQFYEGLDLKITQLIQMYKNIVWDSRYQRWVLPDMMRYFNMKIYISEVRVFHEMRGTFAKGPTLYDFDGQRNLTSLPGEKKWSLNKIAGIGSTVSAVSNQLLGTNSVVSQVLEGANDLLSVGMDVKSMVTSAYIKMCNNVINDVMPTICFDCHMCEFDISETFSYLTELKSSSRNNEGVKPSIPIKVGYVNEYQIYPLNVNLKVNETKNAYVPDGENSVYIDDDLFASKPNTRAIVEEAPFTAKNLNALMHTDIGDRMKATNLEQGRQVSSTGPDNLRAVTALVDQSDTMNYNRDRLNSLQDGIVAATTSTVGMISSFINGDTNFDSDSYATTPIGEKLESISNDQQAMKEAASRPYRNAQVESANPDNYTRTSLATTLSKTQRQKLVTDAELRRKDVGVDYGQVPESVATKPTKEQVAEIIETGNAIKEIANRVYGNKDILSMAISDEAKAKFADAIYSKTLDELEKETTSEIQKKMLKAANIYKK